MLCITRLFLTLGVVLVSVGADTIPTYEVPHPALTSAAISHGEGAKSYFLTPQLIRFAVHPEGQQMYRGADVMEHPHILRVTVLKIFAHTSVWCARALPTLQRTSR